MCYIVEHLKASLILCNTARPAFPTPYHYFIPYISYFISNLTLSTLCTYNIYTIYILKTFLANIQTLSTQ